MMVAKLQQVKLLLSRVEVGLGTEGVTTGESVYKFYDGASDAKELSVIRLSQILVARSLALVSLIHSIVLTSGPLDYYYWQLTIFPRLRYLVASKFYISPRGKEIDMSFR